jgi:fructokinase
MRIGIDLGGTKIEGIAIDENGVECERLRVPTPKGDYGAVVNAVAKLVLDIERDRGQKGTVGVGISGAISPATGLVKNANTIESIGHPLDKDLGRTLGREVRVANDANCFALSEATDGAGAGSQVVFGVITRHAMAGRRRPVVLAGTRRRGAELAAPDGLQPPAVRAACIPASAQSQ